MNLFKQFLGYFLHRSKNLKEEEIVRTEWTEPQIREFLLNLKQVITWTEKLSGNLDLGNGSNAKLFRQTNPEINGIELYDFSEEYPKWQLDDYSIEAYENLLEKALLVRHNESEMDLSQIADFGRIVCFETCSTTHDGVPVFESNGFVDYSDVPPIDTWFLVKRGYFHLNQITRLTLFCWIPKKFEPVMQQAMNVEIFDSYVWLDVNDPEMFKRIKNS